MLLFFQKLLAILGFTGILSANAQPVVNVPAYAPATWNADFLGKSSWEQGTTQFSGGWKNYYDGGFKKINVIPVDKGTFFEITDAPYGITVPKRSVSSSRFVDTNQWNPREGRTISDAPFGANRRWLGVTDVPASLEGKSIAYVGAYPLINGDVVVEFDDNEVRNMVRINAKPPGTTDASVCFETTMDGNAVPELADGTLLTNVDKDARQGLTAGPSEVRGVGIGKARIWDSAKASQAIRLNAKLSGGAVVSCKILPRTFLNAATYPVFTDDTFYPVAGENSPLDGYMGDTVNVAWADAQGDTDANDVDTTTTNLYATSSTNGSSQYSIYRSDTYFNTSALDDTISVTATTIQAYVIGKTNGDNDGDDWINVVLSTSASDATLAGTDFDNVGDAIDNPTEGATRIDIGSVTTGAYNTWTFNATGRGWVSLTGVTRMGWREGHDAIDSTIGVPSITNEINFASADTAGTTQDPLLTVTYGGGSTPYNPQSFIISLLPKFKVEEFFSV